MNRITFLLITLPLISFSIHAVLIEKGPFKGRNARYEEAIKAWVIDGDESKAPEMKKYDGKSITGGISDRKSRDFQYYFKKIWLQQGTETEWHATPQDIIDLGVDEGSQLRSEKLIVISRLEQLAESKSSEGAAEIIDTLIKDHNSDEALMELANKLSTMFARNEFGDDLNQSLRSFRFFLFDRLDAVLIIKDKLANGFGAIAGSLERLRDGGPHPTLPIKSEEIILFHPKLPKAARYFYDMRANNPLYFIQNMFEEGLLLGYAEPDAFAWSFGTREAKFTFPNEDFGNERETGYPAERVKEWRDVGKTRLKEKLGDEYEWVVAEYQY